MQNMYFNVNLGVQIRKGAYRRFGMAKSLQVNGPKAGLQCTIKLITKLFFSTR